MYLESINQKMAYNNALYVLVKINQGEKKKNPIHPFRLFLSFSLPPGYVQQV
jgi:hypothetical protein